MIRVGEGPSSHHPEQAERSTKSRNKVALDPPSILHSPSYNPVPDILIPILTSRLMADDVPWPIIEIELLVRMIEDGGVEEIVGLD